MTTPAEQFAALPEPVQAHLWDVVRHVGGMDEREKADAMAALTGVCDAFLMFGLERHRPALQMLASIGLLISAVHEATQKEAV